MRSTDYHSSLLWFCVRQMICSFNNVNQLKRGKRAYINYSSKPARYAAVHWCERPTQHNIGHFGDGGPEQ